MNFVRLLSVQVILILSFTPARASQEAGGISGGGGDAVASEFAAYGQAWAKVLKDLPSAELSGISPKAFYESVYQTTTLRTQDRVELDGEVDAKNSPGSILISRIRWNQADRAKKSRLVLHEYLGTLGLDRKYELSAELELKHREKVLRNLGMTEVYEQVRQVERASRIGSSIFTAGLGVALGVGGAVTFSFE